MFKENFKILKRLFNSSRLIPNIKNKHIFDGKHFLFLSKRAELNLKVFQYKICTSMKTRESVYQVKQLLALCCNSAVLIFG